MNQNRRTFFMTLDAGGSLLATTSRAQVKLEEKDPQAVALGYASTAGAMPMPKKTNGG